MKYQCISADAQIAKDAEVGPFVNLYGCKIGSKTKVGSFVEVQRGAEIGSRCKISSHSFICDGVTIEDEVFVGHHVVFINDLYPRATTVHGHPETKADWKDRHVKTRICKGAAIGSNATILGGITIGEDAVVGAGSVVTEDVPSGTTVVGNPARIIKGSA